ncbi:MAG TPA: LamG-like jellyroll fold domain-containing protein, partial [Patescibacteria group bacterium]|nr:LamG-like jellyroll fold domain-containing protein [Patescibacteria group bacterium]
VKLFINGQEENTNTISLGESDAEMRIGVDYDKTDCFHGLIDNVYLYNVAKDPEKIRLDFEAGECGGNSCGLDSGHVCHIQGNDDGNCGKEASDVSSCCFTDKRIVPFIDYYYRITTISEAGESPPSDSISSQTICYPPSEEEEQ